MPHARAAILSMGDELTLGQRLDTNGKWLAARLLELGVEPVEHCTVPDDFGATVAAFTRLAAHVDVVISTGGLGPTADDLCRGALARAMDDELVEDPDSLTRLRAWFSGRSRAMPELNRVQAQRPSRGRCLTNGRGTAPGLAGRIGSCDVFCLPGPPPEMIPMFEASVRAALVPAPGRVLRTHALHCFGIGESELASRLGDMMDRSRNPLVGTTASGGVVSIRVRFDGAATTRDADRAMRETIGAAREAAAPYCFGESDATLQSATLSALRTSARTLAVVESCTGGMLGSMFTEVPGSSSVFVGGWITYANEMKTGAVGVPAELIETRGAVSREVAEAMAVGGLNRSGADYCLSITGIAGPDGGSPEKPVGTVWISLAARDSEQATIDTRRFNMGGGDRQSVREWSARAAMMMLYLNLQGTPGAKLLRQSEEHRHA